LIDWQIGQLPPPLPSSSLPNNGPWTPSSPFTSSEASYFGMKFGHVTQATPTLGSFYDPDTVGFRPLRLCQIWSGYLYSFRSFKGVPKFRNSVTWLRPRPLRGHFMVRTPEGCVLDVCTKCEADSSIQSKVIRGHEISKLVTW